MESAHARLAQIGAALSGADGLSVEWSLALASGHARVRDRIIFWLRGAPGDQDRFGAVGALLALLGAPPQLTALHARHAPHSLHQGVGLTLDPGARPDIGLYVHHVAPEDGRERYDAYKWSAGEAVEPSHYTFDFFPPGASAPHPRVHAALAPTYAALLSDPRLTALSGYWLRHRADEVDQISVTYPWQPAVREVRGLGESLSDACAHALAPYQEFHVRHIAFVGERAREPSLTLYFSGAVRAPFGRDFTALQASANEAARASSRAITAGVLADLTMPRGALRAPLHSARPDADAEHAAAQMAWLLPQLARGARVYVVGCGWGGLAAALWERLRCTTVGLTSDRAQYEHCRARGQRVRLGSLATCLPPGRFDAIVIIDPTLIADADLGALRRFGHVLRTNQATDWTTHETGGNLPH